MSDSTNRAWFIPFQDSDPIVSGVLYALVAISVLTWTLIVYKALELWQAARAGERFTQGFWNADDALAYLTAAQNDDADPMTRIAAAGVKAVRHYASHCGPPPQMNGGSLADTLTRALRQSIQDQQTQFESGLGVLATIGNTAPFVGLFGTVIGIMSALKGIAASGSADLQIVSGPIGEALVATAAGIACALPAVVAYNTFLRRLKVLTNNLNGFAYDVLAHLATDRALNHRAMRAAPETP